ncbi:acyltransferase [Serratia marcescens]|uniref:acyltransferase n=1 Tax=Serratia marcescens TaxID=615 RepID=UPI00141CCB22|nr:acyltransferase family protein [Serratia marcescens]CAB1208877.1 Inner membrane protein YiaH [Serratia marcescens]
MNRVNYFDQLKIFSVIAVILFHTSVEYYTFNAHGWVSAIAYSAVTRFCVPIFFMISGATLISKSDSIVSYFKRRFYKIIPPLILWSLIYSFVLSKTNGNNFNIVKSLGEMITTPVYIHFWFIYAIIGLYLIIPVFMSINEDRKIIICAYYTSIWFLFASLLPYGRLVGLPIPEYIGTPYMFNEMYQFFNYSGYMTLGFLVSRVEFGKKSVAIKMLLLSISLSVVLFFMVVHDSIMKGKITQDLWEFKTPLVVIFSISVFLFFKNIKNSKTNKYGDKLSSVAGLVFPIYLVHYLYIFLIVRHFGYVFHSLPVVIQIPLETVIITLCSFITVFVMSKIPFLNRLI